MNLPNKGYDKNLTYFEHNLDYSDIPNIFRALWPHIYSKKNKIRGAHTFEGLEPLTALNSRSSVLRRGSGGWEPTNLEKPIFLPWTFAVGVGRRDPGVSGPAS